ncbi:T9SS type A sorting domain-containing protein [Flavobacterium sp. N1994]|uniref:T9SS type A sorting domain-containing protein n=1 Tax=Flavobacterium sp. N1994 TaxID=2986827 RepID=UPI002223085D|nr:T9SS type A sorting domain-containing protein [Flavobacterium sp. N1994]
MKKLVLLLLFSNFAISQTGVEIRLVNSNVGTPQCDYFFNDWLCNTTNDTGLNAILSNYTVTYFRTYEAHPYPPYQGKIFGFNGTYPAQLITDLRAYSSVVASARYTYGGFSDALYVQFVSAGSIYQTGSIGNVVVTNDAVLNQIFQTYNVFYYSSTNAVVCDCDAIDLKSALDNYTAVIASTQFVQGTVLSNPQFQKPKAIISPNPFSYNFDIQTEQTITNYSITDVMGKTIVSTSSKSNLDNQSSQLSAGMYILNLNFDNGQTANYKLIKK